MAMKTKNRVARQAVVSTTPLGLSAFGFTDSQLRGAFHLRVTSTQPIRWLGEGSTPTQTFGHYIPANETHDFGADSSVKALRMVRAGGSDATCTVTLGTYDEV